MFEPATYSQGIKVSQAQTILFLSGQVAYTADGSVAYRGDFNGQARGAFAAIEALVKSQGGTMANIVKITTYVTDMIIAAIWRRCERSISDQKVRRRRSSRVSGACPSGLDDRDRGRSRDLTMRAASPRRPAGPRPS